MTSREPTAGGGTPHEIAGIERPHRRLWAYKAFASLIFGPLFPIVMVIHYLRYRTLRYRFDDQGISMSWGALRRREINLTYARIQDIHVTSGLIERWFGLARIQIQTASGSHKPEMTIEGIVPFAPLRRFLEDRIRRDPAATAAPSEGGIVVSPDALRELVSSLDTVAKELDRVREALAAREHEHV